MRALGAALLAAAVGSGPAAAQDRPFRSMGVGDGRETLCEIPDVPRDLAYTNAENDAYEYWRQKLELERRHETSECDCSVEVVTWDEVGEQVLPWLSIYREQPITAEREIEAEIEALEARVQEECAG